MTAPDRRRCGASVHHCSECGKAVAPSRVRKGETCPHHPDADPVPGTCQVRLSAFAVRCAWHGGKAPASIQGVVEAEVTADAERVIAMGGWEPVTDPLGSLGDLLGEVVAMKDALAGKVAELRDLTVTDQLGRQDVAAVLSAYERALDRCATVLVASSRLGLDARVVRLRERQAATVVDALSRTLSRPELGLTAPLQAAARALLADELAPSTGGSPR